MRNENLLLALAGFFSWAVVAYIEISRLVGMPYLWLTVMGFVIFLIAFLCVSLSVPKNAPVKFSQTLVLVQLTITLLLLAFHQGPVLPALLVLWSAQLPYFFSQRIALAMTIASLLFFYLIMLLLWDASYPVVTGMIYFGFQLFSLSSSFARVNERAARERGEQLNQQLQATRILLAQSSRQDERVRIARDLHDILGHQLTALNLQLEILQHKVPQDLRDTVQKSKGLAKELLENIRQVVRDQRNLLSLDIRQAVQALVMRIPQLDMHIDGELQLDSVQLAEQIVLCIQEGISNALRHGNATRIDLLLKQQANSINIFLDDNGRGLVAEATSGTGITGMRERLAGYGGVIELSPLAQGCRLAMSLRTDFTEVGHD